MTMNLYIGDYWVPFPSSEYGGLWVVMAQDEEQCIDLLESLSYQYEYSDLIPEAVRKAQVFQLDENVISNSTPRIVENFLT